MGPAAGQLAEIAWFIVLPVLLLMALGFVVQRKLGLDMPTLARLNFYVVVPGMIYFAVVSSTLRVGDVGVAVGFSLLFMAVIGGVTYAVAAVRAVPMDQRRAMVMGTIFYNSGNYGLPLQELAFRPVGLSAEAVAIQVFTMVVQNFTSFTIGVVLAAGEVREGQWRRNLLQVAKFPPLYTLAAALLTIAVRNATTPREAGGAAVWLQPFWDVVVYAKGGFIAVALVTLGAQLALVRTGHNRYPVASSVALRLVGGPMIGLGLVWLLGLEGLIAQVLLISTAMPTSVNCLLICIEFDNHPDFVARTVFHSTLLSPITVTLTILLAQSGIV